MDRIEFKIVINTLQMCKKTALKNWNLNERKEKKGRKRDQLRGLGDTVIIQNNWGPRDL